MKRHLFYSHDGVGLGHTSRNLAIARALTELDPSATVLLATGTEDAAHLGLPERVEILKLPSLRKLANERYASRRLQVNQEQIRSLRSHLLRGVVESYEPHALLVDKHPLGAAGELRGALDVARRRGCATLLGLRDILDTPETVQTEWATHDLPRRIAELYDHVLVYGQRRVFDPIAEYRLPATVAERTRFCGYVTYPGSEARRPRAYGFAWPRGPRPRVLATVGGGEDGHRTLECFVEASRGAPWVGVAVTGPLADPAKHETFRRQARTAGVAVHAFVPGLVEVFRGVGALVCMGGYNTLTEALSLGVPVVCVPRVEPRREQWIRARAFADRHLLQCLTPDDLSPARLRTSIMLALAQSRPALAERCAAELDFDGARRAAVILSEASRVGRIPAEHPTFPLATVSLPEPAETLACA